MHTPSGLMSSSSAQLRRLGELGSTGRLELPEKRPTFLKRQFLFSSIISSTIMALTSKPSTAQPLPSNPYPAENSSHTAYERCLKLERCSDRHTPVEESIMEDMPPIVAARVLGHGLLLAPNDVGHNALVQDILACAHEQRMLAALAHLYVHGLIRACTSSPYALRPPLLTCSDVHSLQSQGPYTFCHLSISFGDSCTRSRSSTRIIIQQCREPARAGARNPLILHFGYLILL